MGKRGPKPTISAMVTDGARPKCPAFLGKHARVKWDAVVEALDAVGVLASSDGDLIAIYCQKWEVYVEACKFIRMPGRKEGKDEAAARRDKAARELAELSKQLLLSPAARAGLKFKPKRQPSEMTRLLEKKRQRAGG